MEDSNEDGFTLVETVIAMTIFAVVVVFASLAVVNTTASAKANESRVSAASMASKYIEQVRHSTSGAAASGTEEFTETANGREYTIKRTISDSQQPVQLTGACNSTLNLPGGIFKTIHVEVTWPNMGSTEPVVNDALTSSPATVPNIATVVQRVVDDKGNPLSGAQVIFNPGGVTRVTDASGCAVFENVTATPDGTASSTDTSKSGLVSDTGAPVKHSEFTVKGGEITEAPLVTLYTKASDVYFTVNPPSGGTTPFPPSVGYTPGNGTPAILPPCGGGVSTPCLDPGNPGTGQNLPPQNVKFFATACPSNLNDSLATSLTSLSSNQSVDLPLKRVVVQLYKTNGSPDNNAELVLYNRCGATNWPFVNLGRRSNGRFELNLPAGSYHADKWWKFANIGPLYFQDCKKFDVSSSSASTISLQGTSGNNSNCPNWNK